MEPVRWVGGFRSPAPLRPFGWCFANLAALTQNPNVVAQRFLCSAAQDPATVPQAALQGSFRLWTVTETPHPAAYAPKGPEHRRSERDIAVPLLCRSRGRPRGRGAAPRSASQALTCAAFPR